MKTNMTGYQRVLKHVKQKEEIIERNQRLLKKWRKKQKYYEKKSA